MNLTKIDAVLRTLAGALSEDDEAPAAPKPWEKAPAAEKAPEKPKEKRLKADAPPKAPEKRLKADKDAGDEEKKPKGFKLNSKEGVEKFLAAKPEEQQRVYGKSTETVLGYAKKKLEALKLKATGSERKAAAIEAELQRVYDALPEKAKTW